MSLTAGQHLSGYCLVRLAVLLLHTLLVLNGLSATNEAITRRVLQITNEHKPGFTLLSPDQTGLSFINHLDEWASAENRVLNNGSGVAAGDFDNDGQIDIFLCSLNNQNSLFRNLGNWRFTNVTAASGLKFIPGFYRAAVFADLNGDGWLDLLVGTVGKGVLCFLNDGRGHFTDVTAQAGATSSYATESLALSDFDGDGALDLYVTNNRTDDIRDWPRIPVVMVNKKPTVPPALRERITFESGQLQEFGEPHFLYRNSGPANWNRIARQATGDERTASSGFAMLSWTNGVFLDETGHPLEKPPLDWGLTAAFRDLNADGFPDLYVCNDYWTPDRIWMNKGDGRFQAADNLAIRKISASSMGVDFADINHDGHIDIFAVDMLSRSVELRKRQVVAKRPAAPRIGDIETRVQTPQNTLLLNRGDGTYAEIAQLAGVAASDWSWSPVFMDVDLDGHDDLLITAGHIRDIQDLDANDKIRKLPDTWRRNAQGAELQRAFTEAKREHTKLYPHLDMPVVAFRNLGNLRFEEVTKPWGLDHPAVNHGIALGDYDGDGDLDAIVNRLGAPAAVFRNDSTAPRVAVRLRDQLPNTHAIGANIELLGGPVQNQKHEITSAGSYLSSSDTLRVFATGPAPKDLTLRITWSSGRVLHVSDVKPNHLYTINEQLLLGPVPRSVRPSMPSPLFEDVSPLLAHTHHEDPYQDFERQPLLPRKLSQSGPGITWFDLNDDGWDDLIIGSGKGGRMAAFLNEQGKRFQPFTHAPFDATASRDQATILAFHLRGDLDEPSSNRLSSELFVSSANYEDPAPNVPSLARYSFSHSQPSTTSFLHNFPSSLGPMALGDIDADGDLDLFVGGHIVPGRYPQPASSAILLQANGRWQLDPTNNKALAAIGLVNGAAWSDLDGDTLPELLLACEWGPIRILRNQRGRLTAWDAPLQHSIAPSLHRLTGLWTGIATGDFDCDGRPDIVAGNWGLNSENVASASKPLTIFYGDLAEQNPIDIVETDFDPVRRQLSPRLQRDALGAALPFVLAAFPTHEAYSRATIKDLLQSKGVRQLTASTLATTLFLNRGDSFEARELPIEAQFSPAFSVQVADFDGDGREDAFLSQNFFAFAREEMRLDSGRGLMLRGDGRGSLEAVPGQLSGLKIYGEQRGAAVADFDGDARVDLAVTQNGAATRLFRNATARPGLRVRLQGPAANRDAIGAVLRVRYGEKQLGPAREIQAGSGYWSQNSSVPVLSIGDGATAVVVRWPDGSITEAPLPRGTNEVVIPRR